MMDIFEKKDEIACLMDAIAEELSKALHLPKDVIMPELKEEDKKCLKN